MRYTCPIRGISYIAVFSTMWLAGACSSTTSNNADSSVPLRDSAADAVSSSSDGLVLDDAASLPPLAPGAATLAGSSVSGALDGDRDRARFNNPVNVTVDLDGDLFVADFDNNLLRRVAIDGTVATVSTGADFRRPFGMTIAADGNLYVQTDVESGGNNFAKGGALWQVNRNSNQASLHANNTGRLRGLLALPNAANLPSGIPSGGLVGSDVDKHALYVFDVVSKQLTLLAGSGDGTPGNINASGAAARFNTPYDLVLTANREIIVADKENHVLRKVTLDGNVSLFAGTGEAKTEDGTLTTAAFNGPQGLALDGAGNVYVSEFYGFVIRRIAPDGQVTTIAGDGTPGYADNADLLAAKFFGLEGIDVSADASLLYVADGTQGRDDDQDPFYPFPYHRIRRLTLP